MQIKNFLLFAVAAIAAPIEVDLVERDSVTCGSNTYSSSQISAAVNAACNGPTVGGYPHVSLAASWPPNALDTC